MNVRDLWAAGAPVADGADGAVGDSADDLETGFDAAWAELGRIGRSPGGGFDRFAWTDADLELRDWFTRAARRRGLAVEADRNGNLWAWWGGPGDGAVVTGSHLDSVPGGGAFDGPLGVVGGLLAIDELRRRHGGVPPRPLAVVVFSDEEGARFGVACVGSRLLTGSLDPDRARQLTDARGTTLADAMRRAGADPDLLGPDDELLARVAAFVELHIEQGRGLVDRDAPVGVATAIWPHGRWRFRFDGEPDHAGTAGLADGHDPMLPFAAAVGAARATAAGRGCLCTFGKALVHPNAANGVAASLEAWLDARAADEATLSAAVDEVRLAARAAGDDHGVTVRCEAESLTPPVRFDAALRRMIGSVLGAAPELPTGAGHDAGILSARLPTAMLFARNPTGVSHSPAEWAAPGDCLAGVRALVAVLEELVWR